VLPYASRMRPLWKSSNPDGSVFFEGGNPDRA
jgi:hypothetical protein